MNSYRRLGIGAGLIAIAVSVVSVAVYLVFISSEPLPTAAEIALLNAEATQDLAEFCPFLAASDDQYYGTAQRAELREELENPSFDGYSWFVGTHVAVAADYLRFGETGEAVRVLTEALDVQPWGDPQGVYKARLLEELSVAYLKMGELDNCISPTGALICMLPLDSSVAHTNRTGSENAVAHLLELLETQPGNIRARWLLNVAHMTLGTYPLEVPAEYLVSPSRLRGDYDIGKFEDIAARVGLYSVNLAGGSIMDDFDNDGLLDIVTSTWDPCGNLAYYHNDGNGSFSDYTVRAGLTGQLGGLNIVQADYNNDGWMDFLVMRGGWMFSRGMIRVSLLRNNADGTFTDVTAESGLAYPAYPSQSAAWADFDNDGDLDLFSCNESMPEARLGRNSASPFDGTIVFPSQLFQNNDDGTFTDVAQQAGVTNLRFCKGSTWGDYDNDGDPDLYLSNFGTQNRLYRNDGNGSFTDVAPELGVEEPVNSFPTWFWDYDNDGWLDLFVAGYGPEIGDVAADYMGFQNDGARPRLYRNDGRGGFVEVTRDAGLWRVHLPMGSNFGDLDNDGFLDFYLGTGYPTYDAIGPNIMYRNNEGETFSDVTFSGGFGHLQKGHGVAFGDIDRDGDQDIFVQIGGFYPGDGFPNTLFENPGHGANWLSIQLEGTESNRAGLGARIKVELETDGTTNTVYAHVTSGGSFGASSLEQEIGLGTAGRIVYLEVYWPTSGLKQVFDEVPLDSHIRVREGDDKLSVLDDIPRVDFASAH